MSLFKQKPSKVKYVNDIQTLDEQHKNHVNKFVENKNSLPQKKTELNDLKAQLEQLQKSEIKSTDDIKQRSELKNQIDKLSDDIRRIENNVDELDYICKTSDIVINYYNMSQLSKPSITDQDDEIIDISDLLLKKKQESEIKQVEKQDDKLVYYNKLSQKNRKAKKEVKKRRPDPVPTNSRTIMNFLSINKEAKTNLTNRATLQEMYSSLVDKSNYERKVKSDKVIMCQICNIEKVLNTVEGCYICAKCGDIEYKIMENETVNKDVVTEKTKYPYKKINHLKEKLNQFQSKENISVPDYIILVIHREIDRKKIPLCKIKPSTIRAILKKYKFTSYYEHLQQIYCKITNKEPITLSRETEDTIINMFLAMQDSFRNHCPPGLRSNFLSYSYTLHKLFLIINRPDCSEYFTLLKSKDKLREQDNIWKNICKDMGWTFYSSF